MMTPRDVEKAVAFGLLDPCELAIMAGSLEDALREAARAPFELEAEHDKSPESFAPTLASERATVRG